MSVSWLGKLCSMYPLLGPRQKGAVTIWGILFLGMTEGQEGKPNCTSTFQASACVTSDNILMVKASNTAKPEVKTWEIIPRPPQSHGKDVQCTIEE